MCDCNSEILVITVIKVGNGYMIKLGDYFGDTYIAKSLDEVRDLMVRIYEAKDLKKA